jgi:hypothetical protein
VFPRFLPLLLFVAATPAFAQRTANNAVTASDDAFGRAVGNEKIGIYTTEDVRGFNPIEAGNVRIEGLYFDQQSTPSSRLVDSSAVRVGYAARGYPFPAPTGIADLAVEKFEGQSVVSLDVEAESRRNVTGSIQAKVPLAGDTLGISAGVGFRSANVPQGRNGHYLSAAANIAWRPVGQDAWSFDLALESFSSATGNRLNNFVAPARETVGIGTRYRFRLGNTKLLLRGQFTNLFNDYRWKVSSSGGFTFTLPRTAVINLAADL